MEGFSFLFFFFLSFWFSTMRERLITCSMFMFSEISLAVGLKIPISLMRFIVVEVPGTLGKISKFRPLTFFNAELISLLGVIITPESDYSQEFPVDFGNREFTSLVKALWRT